MCWNLDEIETIMLREISQTQKDEYWNNVCVCVCGGGVSSIFYVNFLCILQSRGITITRKSALPLRTAEHRQSKHLA